MKINKSLTALTGLFLFSLASTSHGQTSTLILTTDDIKSFGYTEVSRWFDAQETLFGSDPENLGPVDGVTTDDLGQIGTLYMQADRGFAIDFGADYADLSITKVTLGLKLNGSSPTATTSQVFWSNSNADKTFDSGAGDTLAPDFNLFSWSADTSDGKMWHTIYADAPVTPEGRYWIWNFDGTGGSGNGISELVFTVAVPEPSSWALISGITVIGLVAFRRRRAL